MSQNIYFGKRKPLSLSVSLYSEIFSPSVWDLWYFYSLLNTSTVWGPFDILLPIHV